MSWTDDRVALLKKMWKDGHSAADIAKELGKGVTRNAVIGKAHRMGLSGRPSPIKGTPAPAAKPSAKKAKISEEKELKAKKDKTPKVSKGEEAKVKPSKKDKALKAGKKSPSNLLEEAMEKDDVLLSNVNIDTPPADGGVALIDLTERMCKWPYGDPREEGFTFCGRPAYPGKPYCADHVLVAYQSSAKAKALAKMKQQAAMADEEAVDVDIEDLEDIDDEEVDEDEVGNVD